MSDRSPRKSRIALAPLLWGGAGSLLLFGLSWLLWPRPVEVQTAIVDRGEVEHVVSEDARVEVRELYEIAAPVAGHLQRIKLDPGDRVAKGQVLFRIDASAPGLLDTKVSLESLAGVAAAEQLVRTADVDLALAQKQLDRTRQLSKDGFASQAALDRAQAASDAASANLNKAKADLQRAQAIAGGRLGRGQASNVRSPANGVVLRVAQESQTDINAGVIVMEIGDPRDLQIVAEYLSRDAALMKPGFQVRISGIGETTIAGGVRVVEPYARTKVSALGVEEQRVRVLIDVNPDTPTMQIGHGYQADVGVVTFHADRVLRIPTDALVRSDAGWGVFVVKGDRAVLTPVTIGDGDDRFRQLIGGVSENDVVITYPGDTIRDGDPVAPTR